MSSMGEEELGGTSGRKLGRSGGKTLRARLEHSAGEPVSLGVCRDLLGESPVWSVKEQSLYWVDIRGQALRRLDYDTFSVLSWPMPDMPSGITLSDGPELLVVLRSNVVRFDPKTGALEEITKPLEDIGNKRFNESKLDRTGRLWTGRMDDSTRDLSGGLYRLDQDGFVQVRGEVAVPNSLAWSLDGTKMYFADGIEPVIWSFDYDQETGTVDGREPFVTLEPGSGIPDGATLDCDGFVWSAHYGGGAVTRYHPSGLVERTIDLPVIQPTNCAFGGPDLDVLFVTTASQDLQAERGALDGSLLALRVGVAGVLEPQFSFDRFLDTQRVIG